MANHIRRPHHRIVLAMLGLATGFVACKKEYITHEHYTVEQADTVIVVSGDTLFIYGDTVVFSGTQTWVFPSLNACNDVDVKDDAVSWDPSDTETAMGTYPLQPGDRVVVIMQFTLARQGPCAVDLQVNAGMHLGVDGLDLPGSSTAVDVTASLGIPEVWHPDEYYKSFIRVGSFTASSYWPNPVFKPFVRVWSPVCGPNPDNVCVYATCSSMLIGIQN